MGRRTVDDRSDQADAVVDVVVPTMGRWERLGDTLDAIDSQQRVACRTIVVNDSATTTPQWVEARATTVQTGGLGEGAARAAGLALVGSRYVAFCDDDDRWEPSKLHRQLQALSGADGWSLTGAVRVDESDQILGSWPLDRVSELQDAGELSRRILVHNPIPAGPSSMVVDAALLRRVGGWDPHLKYFADWDCFIRLMRVAQPVLINEPLVRYRVWDGQMINDRRRGWTALDRIRCKHQDARAEHGIRPYHDRVIVWIVQGELHTPGRRLAGIREGIRRLM